METNNSYSSSYSSLHIAMYPWLALGHITPFLHISNKLARKGHKISFFVPTKTQSKVQNFNRFPDLITFIPIDIPHVDGLPLGAETTSDVPSNMFPLIMTAMDRTQPAVELILSRIKPDIIFFDLAYWIPKLAKSLGFKSVYLSCPSPVIMVYFGKSDGQESSGLSAEQRLLQPQPGFPDPSIKLYRHELPYFAKKGTETFGSEMKMADRISISRTQCDALASKGSREIEGPFFELWEKKLGRKVLIVGPIIPEEPVNSSSLDPRWEEFLSKFAHKSAVYCGLGSQQRLSKDQFQELVLGLELSGHPFLATLKPPSGVETIKEALPEGFMDRVKGRGVIFEGWIQQQLVLQHPAVGCFVTHCGASSLMEGLMSEECQFVMMPTESDQFFNARMLANRLKAGIEVERGEEDGLFTKESVCRAIRTVMDEDGNGSEIRANSAKLRELLLGEGFESSYIDGLSQDLQDLVFKDTV